MGDCKTDGQGWFNVVIRIPVGAKPGSHLIEAVDSQGNHASAPFTVTKVEVDLSTSVVEPGDVVHVTVTGLGCRMFYLAMLDSMIEFIGSSDGQGRLSINLTIPQLANGAHTLSIIYPGMSMIYTVNPPGTGVAEPGAWAYNDSIVVGEAQIIVRNSTVPEGELDEELAGINASITRLSNDIAALKESLARLEEEVNSLKASNPQLSSQLENLNSGLAEVKGRVDSLQETLNNLKTSISNSTSELAKETQWLKEENQRLNRDLSQARLLNAALLAVVLILTTAAIDLARRQ
ncbi:hypothetical protein [Stetteria hydrogenophila]